MGRRSTYSDQQVFAAVGDQIARGGEFRIHDLAQATGVSIGSLYHRYETREGVLAAAWLDAMLAFHQMFLAALVFDRDAGLRAALATPAFARQHPDRAVILCLGRRETLLSGKAPQKIAQTAAEANAGVKQALLDFARREGLSIEACRHGIVGFPLAAVKQYLPHAPVPASVDDYVEAAYRAVIGIRPRG